MEAGNAEEACCFFLCIGLKALLFSHLLLAFLFAPSILFRLSCSRWTDGQTEAQGGPDPGTHTWVPLGQPVKVNVLSRAGHGSGWH